jgi:hypothetical protein
MSWLCADMSVQQVAVSAAVEFGAESRSPRHHALLQILHLRAFIAIDIDIVKCLFFHQLRLVSPRASP